MKIIMKIKNKVLLVAALSSPLAVMAQEAPAVLDEAASGFSSSFVAAAAVIGGAMITAAFGAIVWKWVKGMVFS